MRQFTNFAEALNEIKRDLKEMGVIVHTKSVQNKNIEGKEEFATYELINYDYYITNPHYDQVPKDMIDEEWCKAEFEERIGPPTNPGEAWKLRRPYWEQFLNRFLRFDYSYSERIYPQLDRVINVLKRTLLPEELYYQSGIQVRTIRTILEPEFLALSTTTSHIVREYLT